jgi:benzoyl-CoA 2,3-dioxygenase component B
LGALAESAFDPLARSCRFMLTEEAHHLFVGEMGVARVIQRTADLMKNAPSGDVVKGGGIPLDLLQRYVNEWLSASMDLFGGEDSSNSATFFAAGLKGRWEESKAGRFDDHKALHGTYGVDVPNDSGGFDRKEIPLRRAMNLVLRDSYVTDCERVLKRWNKVLERNEIKERLYLPSDRFNRKQGLYANMPFDPWGKLLPRAEWEAKQDEWLPTEADYTYVKNQMVPCHEPGKFANWIAPPKKGLDGKPVDFQYVKFVRA